MQELNLDFPAASASIAYSYIEASNKGIADYNEAIAVTPHDAETYNNLGIAYNKNGEYDLAIANFSKAIELDPEHTGAYNDRGVAYDRKG